MPTIDTIKRNLVTKLDCQGKSRNIYELAKSSERTARKNLFLMEFDHYYIAYCSGHYANITKDPVHMYISAHGATLPNAVDIPPNLSFFIYGPHGCDLLSPLISRYIKQQLVPPYASICNAKLHPYSKLALQNYHKTGIKHFTGEDEITKFSNYVLTKFEQSDVLLNDLVDGLSWCSSTQMEFIPAVIIIRNKNTGLSSLSELINEISVDHHDINVKEYHMAFCRGSLVSDSTTHTASANQGWRSDHEETSCVEEAYRAITAFDANDPFLAESCRFSLCRIGREKNIPNFQGAYSKVIESLIKWKELVKNETNHDFIIGGKCLRMWGYSKDEKQQVVDRVKYGLENFRVTRSLNLTQYDFAVLKEGRLGKSLQQAVRGECFESFEDFINKLK